MQTYKKKRGPRYLSIKINWNSPDNGYATLTSCESNLNDNSFLPSLS